MPYLAISEYKMFGYECDHCGKEWTMSLPGRDSRRLENDRYFCPYCGTKHTPKAEPDSPTDKVVIPPIAGFATDLETGYVDPEDDRNAFAKGAPSFTIKSGEKTAEQLKKEDQITSHNCPDGGWWNPITKKCQGEGVGHNLELDIEEQS